MRRFGERLAKLSDRFYDRMRHRDAYTAAGGEATAQRFDALRGHEVRPAQPARDSRGREATPA